MASFLSSSLSLVIALLVILTFKAQESTKQDAVYKEVDSLIESNLDSAYIIATQLEIKATKHKDTLALIEAYNYLGMISKRLHKNYQALDFLYRSLEFKKRLSPNSSISNTLNSIGSAHHKNGDLDLALDLYLKAIKIINSEPYSIYQTAPHLNICRLYIDIQEMEKAKVQLVKTDLLISKNNDTTDIPILENLWGMYYQNLNQIDSAKTHYNNSLIYNQKYGSGSSLANSFNNMAIIYFYENELEKSYLNFKHSYEIRKTSNDTLGQLASLCNLGDFHQETDNIDSALFFYKKGLELALEKKSNVDIRDFYLGISNINENKGNVKKALKNYKLYIDFHEKATKNKNIKRIEELEAKYQFEQQEKQIYTTRKNNRQLIFSNHLIEKEKKRAKNLNSLFILLTILLVSTITIISYILFRNNKLSKDLKETAISKEEKITLIKEVHHRVKNNLQIITSLLRLQASTIDDEKTVSHFVDCEQRIAAMALVHEKLYKSNNFSAINLSEYVDELIRNLIASYSSNFLVIKDTFITLEELDLDTIIPVSLIINECVTNSFKHGYSKDNKRFTISCKITKEGNNKAKILIGDNGQGFPKNFSLKNNNSLGVELIDSLIEQIDGSVRIINQDGAYYEIIFPLK